MTIAAILKHKGSDIAAVAPHHTLADVAGVLSSRRIGAVVVRDADARLLGILSERDIVRCLATHGAAALDKTAAEVMTRAVRTVALQSSVADAMTLMTEGRFRHLPVLDHDQMVGIISIGDVVKAKITQQEAEVDSLKAYVSGTG